MPEAWRAVVKAILQGASMLVLLALLPSPLRADCTHAPGSWSDFQIRIETTAPPTTPRHPDGFPAARPEPADREPLRDSRSPEPREGSCWRCNSPDQGSTSPGVAAPNPLDLLGQPGEPHGPQLCSSAWDGTPQLYQFDPVSAIAHPPRSEL
jgi:hypothetical protein